MDLGPEGDLSAPGFGPRDENRSGTTSRPFRLKRVPKAFRAGGDWKEWFVTVDNSKGSRAESYILVLTVFSGRAASEDTHVQVFLQGAWHDAPVVGVTPDGHDPTFLLSPVLYVPVGRTDVRVRARFGAGAPAEAVRLEVKGVNIDPTVPVGAASRIARSKIVRDGTPGTPGTPGIVGVAGRAAEARPDGGPDTKSDG
ncbi:hypothetical protein ACFVTF_06780 [Kitasatospora sp. NPDC057940]|uniref:hypothetical protein n=1 Tax=Kitasatospora sp. NPDC057940 TaxID=3346285 RepID=UPI0036DC0016